MGYTERRVETPLSGLLDYVAPIHLFRRQDSVQIHHATKLADAVLLALAHCVQDHVFGGGHPQGRVSWCVNDVGAMNEKTGIELNRCPRAGQTPVDFHVKAVGMGHSIMVEVSLERPPGGIRILASVPQALQGFQHWSHLLRVHENVQISHGPLHRSGEDPATEGASLENHGSKSGLSQMPEHPILLEVPENGLPGKESKGASNSFCLIREQPGRLAGGGQVGKDEALHSVLNRKGGEMVKERRGLFPVPIREVREAAGRGIRRSLCPSWLPAVSSTELEQKALAWEETGEGHGQENGSFQTGDNDDTQA